MVDFERQARSAIAWAALAVAVGCSTTPVDEPGFDGAAGVGGTAGAGAAGATGEGASVTLEGAVQKGPLVVGSSVVVTVLDARLDPTGQAFETLTTNDRGEFSLSYVGPGPISLRGEGLYFNEVSGALSVSPVTLRTFFVPSGEGVQQVYVNLITHLTTERIAALVEGGTAFSAAVVQAEGELLRELGITADDYTSSAPGTSLNVAGGDNDDNAYLFGLSATLLQLASDRSAGAVDAPLQETLNSLASGFRDGAFDADQKVAIAAALAKVDVPAVTRNLAAHLAQVGSTERVPDLNRVLDQDGDGVANAHDVCRFVSGPQADTDGDGRGDACDPCPATACEFDCLPANPNEGGPATDTCVEPGAEVACDSDPTLCATADAAAGAEGARCRQGRTCDAGLTCVRGEACEDSGFDSCCRPTITTGPVCSNDPEALVECERGLVCLSGAACDPSGPASCCRAPGELGSACLDDGQGNTSCNGGLSCDVSIELCNNGAANCCIVPRPEGDTCLHSDTCGAGLACVNDNESCPNGPCCLPAGGAGEPCPRDAPCDAGLICDSCAEFEEGCCFPQP